MLLSAVTLLQSSLKCVKLTVYIMLITKIGTTILKCEHSGCCLFNKA